MSLLQDPQIRAALQVHANAAPNGWDSFNTLPDDVLIQMLVHPDTVRVVWTNKYRILLRDVDQYGYQVFDKTFTYSHRVEIDPEYPDYDISQDVLRPMVFGNSLLDLNFMLKAQHGDWFYIRYQSGDMPDHIVLVVVLDPVIE